jgi:peptide deformylase
MDNLRLVDENDPILRTPTEPFDFKNPPVDPVVLKAALLKAMDKAGGMGLAANQVGLPYRVFVMRTTPDLSGSTREYACFNPRVLSMSEDKDRDMEGCLSFPDLWLKVDRPKTVSAEFTNEFGDLVNEMFVMWNARCYLHETDHLNGDLFVGKVGPLTLKRALSRRKRVPKTIV